MGKPSDKFMRLTKAVMVILEEPVDGKEYELVPSGPLRLHPEIIRGWDNQHVEVMRDAHQGKITSPPVMESAEEIEAEYNRAVEECKKNE